MDEAREKDSAVDIWYEMEDCYQYEVPTGKFRANDGMSRKTVRLFM